MKTISSLAFVAAAVMFSASNAAAEPIPGPTALLERQYNTLTYKGCFSSSTGLSFNTSYNFNTKGYCQTQCVPAGATVQATTSKSDCWCGNDLPPSSSKVDDSFCNDPCAGYGTEMCGSAGSKYFSVYLTGLDDNSVGGSGSGSSSSTSVSGSPSQTSTAKPSVVTVGGQTVVVTATGSAASSKGGPSKAGIAAGVVVGIVAIGAIAGGVFLALRNKKRRAIEEEYKRNAAVSNFIAGGKPPSSSGGNSSLTDTRLDPVLAHRRMSDGSIADNQDYSRRILKVTNA